MGSDGSQRPHLSATQIGMLLRCGEQYRRRYIVGDVCPPGVSLIRGSAVHRARATNLSQKIESGKDLPAEAVIQAAADAVATEFKGEIALTDEEVERGLAAIRGEVTDAAVRLTGLDYQEFQTTTTPVAVELRLEVKPRGFPSSIVGYIDLIDVARWIRDAKTTGRKPSQGDADRSDQLTTYSVLWRANYNGMPEAGLALDCLVDTKIPKAVQVRTSRDVGDIEAWLNRLGAAAECIEKGAFLPASDRNPLCSEKFCGYYPSCLFVSRRRRPIS